MPKDLLTRAVDDDLVAWVDDSPPPGMKKEINMKQVPGKGMGGLSAPTRRRRRDRVKKFRFIDLFAGIGGFHIGMAMNGGECVFTSEWDRWAAVTYRAWTGVEDVRTEDIRDLDFGSEIPDHDVLCAGFPCQPFSIAGVSKKNSLGRAHGFDDERQGNLFFAICEIAAVKRPAVLFLENVKNLKSHDGGNTFREISRLIDELGYEMRSAIVDARAWVPQHRERIFLVCFDRMRFTDDEIGMFRFPMPPTDHPVLGQILEEDPDPKYTLTDGLWTYLREYAEKHRAKGNGFGYGLVGPEDVARTMSARYYKDGSEILIRSNSGGNPRRLTISEATRLMGYTPEYARRLWYGDAGFPQVVSDTQAYRQLGNSVAPPVVEAIGALITKVLLQMKDRTGE